MNLLLADLMDKPSIKPGYCVVCGDHPATSHHVVPRSQGGRKGPELHLCGHGTSGCHGQAEDKKLHFRFTERWEYLRTETPTKYEKALTLDGWRPIPEVG